MKRLDQYIACEPGFWPQASGEAFSGEVGFRFAVRKTVNSTKPERRFPVRRNGNRSD